MPGSGLTKQRAPEVEPTPRAPDPKPLSPRRYKLQVTLDEQGHDDLEALQDLLAHDIPDGDPAKVVKRALALLRQHTEKKKAALTDRPRSPKPTSSGRSRTIPAHIKREVWQRDGGRCAFVGQDGRRCSETRRLEYGHLQPWGKGGGHDAGNVALRCRGHNAYEAVRDYGEVFMADKSRAPERVRESLALYSVSRWPRGQCEARPSWTSAPAGRHPGA